MTVGVYYRVNPKVSKTPAVHPTDKYRLVEYALKSFKEGLGELDVELTVLYDSCPPEYPELFRQHFPGHNAVTLDNAGNRGSWQRQLDIAAKCAHDLVYFVEDDYYHRPRSVERLADFMVGTGADFATPYDHPDYYTFLLHRGEHEMVWYKGDVYWTCGTTTNTFMVRRPTFHRVLPVLETFTHGNSDAGYWMSLTGQGLLSRYSYWSWRHAHWPQLLKTLLGKGYKLWRPVPGTASHLEKTCLTPGLERIIMEEQL